LTTFTPLEWSIKKVVRIGGGRIGGKAWMIDCDPEWRLLRVVLVSINPNDPYVIQDCTMDRNDPTSTNGIPCQGEVKLPLHPKNSTSEACTPYLLSDPSPVLDRAAKNPANVCRSNPAADVRLCLGD
jgi:hypothetical protein